MLALNKSFLIKGNNHIIFKTKTYFNYLIIIVQFQEILLTGYSTISSLLRHLCIVELY